MRRKHVTVCSIAMLFILLQADVTHSRRGGCRSRSRSRSSSSSSRWGIGSHNKSSKSIENSGQSVQKPDTHLAYGASTPEHDTVQHPNYPVRHNVPSYNPSFPLSYPRYPDIAADSQDDLDYIGKLIKHSQRPDYLESFGYPSYRGDSSWGQYHSSPREPKISKPTLKPTAGAGAPGATGHLLPGCPTFAMRFHFNYVNEDDWWYKNCDRYAHRVSFPRYNGPVPEDVFMKDCWNATLKEFVASIEKEQADEMETKVLQQVVRQMCVKQYQMLPQPSGEDRFRGTHKMKPVSDGTIAEAEGEAAVLSAPASVCTHSHLDDVLLFAILPMLLIVILYV